LPAAFVPATAASFAAAAGAAAEAPLADAPARLVRLAVDEPADFARDEPADLARLEPADLARLDVFLEPDEDPFDLDFELDDLRLELDVERLLACAILTPPLRSVRAQTAYPRWWDANDAPSADDPETLRCRGGLDA
jgi:hypothetical protein